MEWTGRYAGVSVPLMSRRQLVPFVPQGYSEKLDCCLVEASPRNYLPLPPQYLIKSLDGEMIASSLLGVSR